MDKKDYRAVSRSGGRGGEGSSRCFDASGGTTAPRQSVHRAVVDAARWRSPAG